MAVGRFQVMAVLQAARAYVLGLPLDMAKSWGLNRAIFYAAAKRGFRTFKAVGRPAGQAVLVEKKPEEELENIFHLGDEIAFVVKEGDKMYFAIGGKKITPKDFARQIEARFGKLFPKIWEEAVQIVSQYDKKVLLSQREFYKRVYEPRRDVLAQKWSKMVEEHAKR